MRNCLGHADPDELYLYDSRADIWLCAECCEDEDERRVEEANWQEYARYVDERLAAELQWEGA